jgi:hypothetical protein
MQTDAARPVIPACAGVTNHWNMEPGMCGYDKTFKETRC